MILWIIASVKFFKPVDVSSKKSIDFLKVNKVITFVNTMKKGVRALTLKMESVTIQEVRQY